ALAQETLSRLGWKLTSTRGIRPRKARPRAKAVVKTFVSATAPVPSHGRPADDTPAGWFAAMERAWARGHLRSAAHARHRLARLGWLAEPKMAPGQAKGPEADRD